MIKPTVSVIVLTYNHEKYISECLDSLLAQITDFEYEIIVGEDCSNDQTRQIIQKYAQDYSSKIKLVLSPENQGALEVEERVISAATGKYIAFCEGDDFWHDPNKLQLEVDFLEANQGYGIVHTDINMRFEAKEKVVRNYNQSNQTEIPVGDIYENLMVPSHLIKTMTVCVERKLLVEEFSFDVVRKEGWISTDLAIWLTLSRKTKIGYINRSTATYRLINESASRSKNPQKLHKFHLNVYKIRNYFADKYGCKLETLNKIELAYHKMLYVDGYKIKDKKMFISARKWLENHDYKFTIKDRLLSLLMLFCPKSL